MAEGLLKKMLKGKGIEDIKVSSAGISAISGFTPTDKAISVMKKGGVDISGYRSTKLAVDLIDEADLILVMENMHKFEIERLAPKAKEKTYLLREYVNKKEPPYGSIVPDPIGQPLEIYERVFTILKESIEELIEKL